MTVLVTLPQSTYSDAAAKKIFDEIVHDFSGVAATQVSSFENEDYKTDADTKGLVNMGEFDLPEPVDYALYDSKKASYEEKYQDLAITIEASDTFPIREEVDININP